MASFSVCFFFKAKSKYFLKSCIAKYTQNELTEFETVLSLTIKKDFETILMCTEKIAVDFHSFLTLEFSELADLRPHGIPFCRFVLI